MALANYADLQAAVASWLDRDDLTANLPDFIALAESRIAKRLRVSQMETTATVTLTSGAGSLPSDFIEARKVVSTASGAYATPLQTLTPGQGGDWYPTSASGVPEYYSISGGTLTTYPNGGSGALSLSYYAKPPALATSSTNWLLTKWPDIYLYGSLLEAAPYLGDDARVQTWGALFNQAIDEAQGADQRSRYANSVSRVRMMVTP